MAQLEHEYVKGFAGLSAPQSKNVVNALQIKCKSTSFSFGEILQKWADDEIFFITKSSIYYIQHVLIQLFSMEVD